MPAARHSRTAQPERNAIESWLAVLSVALGAFVVVTSEFLPIGLLTHIAAGLHVSDGTAGLMITIPGLVAAVAAPLLTITFGRMDRRKIVLGLMTLLAVSNVIAATAPNFNVMLLGRVLFGISLGGFWTVAVTLGARLVPAASLARATTIILAGISFATVIGVPIGSVIASTLGWRAAFVVLAIVAVVIGLAQLFVLPSLPPPPTQGVRQLTYLLRHKDARLGLLTIALVIAGHFAAYTYVTPFLKENPAVTPGFLSTLLLAYGVAGIVGNFAGGTLAARYLRPTLGGVIALLAGSILLLPLVHGSLPAITTLLVLWGLAFGALPISLQLWVFKAAPEALEGGAALLVSTFQIFIALGSVLGGRIVDASGTSAVMWTGGAVALSAISIVLLSRHKPAPAATPDAPQPHLA
jgi:predicted MFS family arabinose efflux permease